MMINLLLSMAAGGLTILSPCVLPVVPLVMGGSSRSSRFGPIALLAGMIISFAVIGTFASAILFQLGLSPDALTNFGAILLILVGLFLLSDSLGKLFKVGTTGFSQKLDSRLQSFSLTGFQGQFVIGLAIGLIWAPCTGPTLGAAIALAAQGENLWVSFATMLAFGLGAAIPLGVLGLGAKKWASKRGQFIEFSQYLKKGMGFLFAFIGIAILFGWHKWLETQILELLPEWWVNMITSL
jgi:cytochrome c biogenesis protein CcdA